jgi:Flp pilus assembly pilin Flp
MVNRVLPPVSRVEDREEAQGLVEYALILVLCAIVAILALGFLGTTISSVYNVVAAAL